MSDNRTQYREVLAIVYLALHGAEWRYNLQMFRFFLDCAEKIAQAGLEIDYDTLETATSRALPEHSIAENDCAITPDTLGVRLENGQVIVSSKDVARVFGKRHDDVLKSIRNLDCSQKFHARNFADMMETVDIGRGARRESPVCQMTRDGFTFLAMGYTGSRAAAFKEAYINRFNEMEATLRDGNIQPLPAPAENERERRLAIREKYAEARRMEAVVKNARELRRLTKEYGEHLPPSFVEKIALQITGNLTEIPQ